MQTILTMRNSSWLVSVFLSFTFIPVVWAIENPTMFPLLITEHFNRSGNQFATCSVVMEIVDGRKRIRTDLGAENRWHLRGGGFSENGYQTGTVWEIETTDAQGLRQKTTVTFDSDFQSVLRAQMISTDSSGAIVSKYVCIKPLLS